MKCDCDGGPKRAVDMPDDGGPGWRTVFVCPDCQPGTYYRYS